MSQGTVKQGIGLHESQGIQLFFAVTWHAFRRLFQSVLLLYQHAREFGYLVALWCHMPFPHWFCSTFPHINVMYQEFVCTRIQVFHFSFGVTWHMLFPQWCHSVLENCSSFLIYQHKVLCVRMAEYSCRCRIKSFLHCLMLHVPFFMLLASLYVRLACNRVVSSGDLAMKTFLL